MEPSRDLTRIVNLFRFSVDGATLLATDRFHGQARNGRNTFLYRTPKGNYFKVKLSQWENELSEELIPIEDIEALELFEKELNEHLVSHEEAFPDLEVEDA